MKKCAAHSTSSRNGDDPDEHNSDDSDATEKKIAPSPNGSPKRKRSQDDADESTNHDAESNSAGIADDQSCTDKAPPRKRAATSKAKAAAKAKPAPKPAPKPAAKPAAKKRAAAKKTVRPPPPPSTRPSRARKAPKRFGDAIETKPVKPVKAAKKAPVKKGGKVFDPVYITTNSTSRLVKADVFHMLLEPAAWMILSSEQKVELMLMLPPTRANTDLLEWIRATNGHGDSADTRPWAFQLSNDCFRTDVAKFRADLGNGHLGKTWQASAEQATIDRATGVYDAFKAEEFEEWWGQKGASAQ